MIGIDTIRAMIRAGINEWHANSVESPFYFEGQTEDATPVVMATVEMPGASAGVVKIDVIAIADDGSGSFQAVRYVPVSKYISSLGFGTPLLTATETDLTGPSIDVVADADENISVEVTGIAATLINWKVKAELFIVNASATP